jgi:hypothetical protein
MNEALAVQPTEQIEWTPKEFEAQIANETRLREILLRYVKSNMIVGHHYFQDRDKQSLKKEGALNLCSLFKVKPEPRESDVESDGQHLSVFYRVDLVSLKTGRVVATGDGYCTSKESKYRRNNHADVFNTVYKMAFKRAVVAAALQLPIVSELFTQDIEDMTSDDHKAEAPRSVITYGTNTDRTQSPIQSGEAPKTTAPTEPKAPLVPEASTITAEQTEKIKDGLERCITLGSFLDKKEAWDWFKGFSKKESFAQLSIAQADEVIVGLRERYKKVPSNKIQRDEILSLLEKLIAKGVYKSPADATQDFERTFGVENSLSYINARKAIAALTAQVSGI